MTPRSSLVRRLWLVPAAAASMAVAPAEAQGGMSIDEALASAFPLPAEVDRRTAYLAEVDIDRARALAGPGVELKQSVVTYYVAMRAGEPVGYAYFDPHRVRTLPEVLMIVVTPGSAIDRIEVVRFAEPPEYKAPERWLATFVGRVLDGRLSLKGDIVTLTGATLTSDAVTEASRRVLALHQVIHHHGDAEDDR